MKVSNTKGAKSAASAGNKKKASGKSGEFAEQLREAAGASEASEVMETSAVGGGVESLLAVQAEGSATDERKQRLTHQYGADLLDRLGRIHADLLAGAISKDRLCELAQAVRAQRKRCQDPKLNEIISQIELRAEVEIAKLTQSGKS